MATKRTKQPAAPAIESIDHLYATVDEIARIEVSLRGAVAIRDAAVQQVLAQYDGPIEEQKTRLKSLVALAGTYAKAHQETIFGSRLRSATTALATFGFREGNDTLKTLNSKWTWDKVKERLQELGKYLRTVEEIDKEALHKAALTDSQYADIGLRMDRPDRFYVEAKSPDSERITTDLQPIS